MNSNNLAGRIVALRKSKGFSQEKLAELASINLRTLQRMEKSETEPRGDTLRLIASALEVPVESLISSDMNATPGLPQGASLPGGDGLPDAAMGASNTSNASEDKGFLQFMNLSALAFWIFPLGNIALPMLLWFLKKDQVKDAGKLGRRILDFQMTWSLVVLLVIIVFIVSKILHLALPISPMLFWVTVPAFYILNTLAVLLASLQLVKGRERIFSLSLKILR